MNSIYAAKVQQKIDIRKGYVDFLLYKFRVPRLVLLFSDTLTAEVGYCAEGESQSEQW